MFYDIYKKLCEENGEKPYQLPLKLGAKSNSMVAQWKNGSVPRSQMLQKIADYFHVSVGYLIDGDTEQTTTFPPTADLGHHETAQPQNPERAEIDDATLKFALWGDADEITDADLEDVRRYAEFIKERKKHNGND